MNNKFIFGAIVMFFMILTAKGFAQTSKMSNQEIVNVINNSKQANESRGVINPDIIQPGQLLDFQFADGNVQGILVPKGGTQWELVKAVRDLEKVHGPLVPYEDQDPGSVNADTPGMPAPTPELTSTFWFDWPMWAQLLSLIGFALIVFLVLRALSAYYSLEAKERRRLERERLTDPVRAGVPKVPGGVRDNAHARRVAQTIAEGNYGNNFNLRDVQQGFLHGQNATVEYGDGTTMNHTFRNQPGYRGVIDIKHSNGELETRMVYFLQACGNDVQVNRHFRATQEDSLSFTLEPIEESTPVSGVENAPVSNTSEERQTDTKDVHSEAKVSARGNLPLTADALKAMIDAVSMTSAKVKMEITVDKISFESEGVLQKQILQLPAPAGNHVDQPAEAKTS